MLTDLRPAADRTKIDIVIYPPEIGAILADLRHAGSRESNCRGSEANFACGCVVRFSALIPTISNVVEDAGYVTNGCGHMVAAAEVLSEHISGRSLDELGGLDVESLSVLVSESLGSNDRPECVSASISALRSAFADLRSRRVEEFLGEKALVCTCFGVSEDRIEALIESQAVVSVEAVGDACNAGRGCGSCRMIIQEMLDAVR